MRGLLSKKVLFSLPVVLIVIASIGAAVYFYKQYDTIKKNPQIVSQEQVKAVTSAIGKFMDLPTDEQPTLATVTDQTKLKDQAFFKNSKNGDQLLIYTKAQLAILFRPSINRIVQVAPLVLGAQTQASDSANISSSVKVAIYNGSKVNGLTNDYSKKLSGINGITITSKTNASKTDYSKTQVIDLSGKNQNLASQIAELLGGDVVNKLPEGETDPKTDILVIAASSPSANNP